MPDGRFTEISDGLVTAEDVQVFTIGGEDFKLTDVNIQGSEIVQINKSRWNTNPGATQKFVFQRHSFTLLRWQL
jgi:hypothetical protein